MLRLDSSELKTEENTERKQSKNLNDRLIQLFENIIWNILKSQWSSVSVIETVFIVLQPIALAMRLTLCTGWRVSRRIYISLLWHLTAFLLAFVHHGGRYYILIHGGAAGMAYYNPSLFIASLETSPSFERYVSRCYNTTSSTPESVCRSSGSAVIRLLLMGRYNPAWAITFPAACTRGTTGTTIESFRSAFSSDFDRLCRQLWNLTF